MTCAKSLTGPVSSGRSAAATVRLNPDTTDNTRHAIVGQRATTNTQRPTTNDPRPTTNDPRPTTNDQRLTTNDQRLTTTGAPFVDVRDQLLDGVEIGGEEAGCVLRRDFPGAREGPDGGDGAPRHPQEPLGVPRGGRRLMPPLSVKAPGGPQGGGEGPRR